MAGCAEATENSGTHARKTVFVHASVFSRASIWAGKCMKASKAGTTARISSCHTFTAGSRVNLSTCTNAMLCLAGILYQGMYAQNLVGAQVEMRSFEVRLALRSPPAQLCVIALASCR